MNFRDIRQSEAAECGLVCLAVVSAILGGPVNMSQLRRQHPVSPRGLTLKDIIDIAAAMHMSGRAVRCELSELGDLARPSILHWGLNHFVVLERVSRGKAHIIDPASGPMVIGIKEVSRHFTGIALELSAAPAFKRRRPKSPLQFSSLVRLTPEIRSGLAQALMLSLVLQAYVVASPFYMQLAIDEVALKGDDDLLAALAIGFGLFAGFNAIAEALRGLILQQVSSLLSWDMTRRLFHHMVRLPLPWFQRRRLADALSRFDSLNPIKSLIANGLVSSIIDGALSVVTIVMMSLFSVNLALITIAGFLVYVLLRLISLPLSMRLGEASLRAGISEQGVRIETLRAIQTIKVMALEGEREGHWANRFAETVKAGQANAFANLSFATAQRFFDAITLVLIIYLGAKSTISGRMTIGVLYAFISYRGQFLARAQGLFETFLSWRLLDIHSHRLSDIVLQPREYNIDQTSGDVSKFDGRIELKDISFSYASHEKFVFQKISLVINSGEFIAIVGPSGAGKSTLLKVIAGLYSPTHGEVRLDGRPIAQWGPRTVRRAMGVVMQDDELLSGSIAENVALFDERIDMERVWRCLQAAAIIDEINAMPMRADTLVGDMGSSLSGGQKQRLLIARALYRDPSIVIFDEATSHLDLRNESIINDALVKSNVTRVVVAHRPETIAKADRVYDIATNRVFIRST